MLLSQNELSNASTTDNTFHCQHLPKYNIDIGNHISHCATFNTHVQNKQIYSKKRSKLSLYIISQSNKETIDDYKNVFNDISQCELFDECGENVIVFKNVEIFYYICLYGGEFVMTSSIRVNDNASVNEVLCLAVRQFNNERFKLNMERGDCYVSMKEWEKEEIGKGCELREVKKKTMLPKMDWPPFYGEAKMKDLNMERFAFVVKDYKMVSLIRNSIWNDGTCKRRVINENEDEMTNERKCMKGCLIM